MHWSLFAAFPMFAICSVGQEPVPPERPEPSREEMLASGSKAFHSRDFSLTIKSIEPLCTRYPNSQECAQGKLMWATANFLSSRYAEAVSVLESLPLAGRQTAEILHMLGSSYIYLGRGESAQRTLSTLSGLPPDSLEARLLTARMMIRLERETDAEKILVDLARRDSPPPATNYYLGILFLHRSQLDEAIAAFRREVIVNPTLSDAHYKLGDAYGRKQEWGRGIPHLQMSIWLNPDQSGPYILLGKAYLNTGSLQNAEAMLRRSLEIDPNSSSAAYTLAQVLTRAGKRDEAKALFEKVRSMQK
jgi:tetratricopeptide (TPR) repeat protein